MQKKSIISKLSGKQILIPITALLLLAVFNLVVDPSFYKITMDVNSAGNHVLSGYLIIILDYGSELAILAIGMTLVTAASGGQDISVGAGIAIAGSVILRVLCGGNSRPDELQAPIIVAFLISCVVAMLFGAFNGILVAHFKIQPMVATLILYTAGRSIAAWINNNELPVISDPTFIKFLSFVILGLCVAVVGLIKVSRISSINYSVIAKDIEMDAILAVALGGNSLSGGKFNMTASILGAYVIQFLTTTLYKFDVKSDAISAYKAVVVIILVVISAPVVREKMTAIGKKLRTTKEVG